MFPAEGAEAASTKTVSSSGPTSVAVGSFAQTLGPALAQTPRDKSCGCQWVAKHIQQDCFSMFMCVFCLCTHLPVVDIYISVQSCPTSWCYAHIFGDILSSAVRFFFSSFCAETLNFISLILPHRRRETGYPSLSNYKRLESQVRREK